MHPDNDLPAWVHAGAARPPVSLSAYLQRAALIRSFHAGDDHGQAAVLWRAGGKRNNGEFTSLGPRQAPRWDGTEKRAGSGLCTAVYFFAPRMLSGGEYVRLHVDPYSYCHFWCDFTSGHTSLRLESKE